jgi:hypothetical protein
MKVRVFFRLGRDRGIRVTKEYPQAKHKRKLFMLLRYIYLWRGPALNLTHSILPVMVVRYAAPYNTQW